MLQMTKRKKVVQGATNSGKTYGIVPIFYDKCLAEAGIKATITADTLGSLKDGAIDIFKKFMMDEGRWDDAKWNATDYIYTLGGLSTKKLKELYARGAVREDYVELPKRKKKEEEPKVEDGEA